MTDNISKYFAFSGIPTFWRAPHTRVIDGADIVIMGVPFDCGVSNRSGTRSGPQSIRQMSLYSGNFCHPWDFDIKDKLHIIDYGDVGMIVGGHTTKNMIKQTYHHAAGIFEKGARLFSVGGDHTIPYGLIRAAKKKFGRIALVHFDSHQDSRDGEKGRAVSHATFAYDLAEEGTVDAAHSTQIFIRTDMPNKHGYNILYARDAFYMKPSEVAAKIRENAGCLPVYLTFDIDAIDPAHAPGTGTPVPGGPSTAYVREVLRYLEGLNVVGGDIVEVAPQYDTGDITSLAAGVIAGDILQLIGRSILLSR
ncbi:agmatinase [Enterobacter bugandensis]|nr:agmatinase [Enterobacter bugandensis]